MAFVMAEEGAVVVLQTIKDNYADSQWHLRLYTNNHTPDPADDVTDYTAAADIDPVDNLGTYYSTPMGAGDGSAEMHIDELVCPGQTAATVQTCYGYYVYDDDDILVFAERFTTSVSLSLLGEQVHIPDMIFRCHS